MILGTENDKVICELRDGGSIASLRMRHSNGWHEVGFRTDRWSGPSFNTGVTLGHEKPGEAVFSGVQNDLHYRLAYEISDDRLRVSASVNNLGEKPFSPDLLSLILGIDTYMEKFPDWNDRYFPTLLRCEKTHFWGYAMTPCGSILGISSPDPVASWHLEYKPNQHRIYTLCLDLLHAGPLPERHPQKLDTIQPGQRREWTLFLEQIPSLDQVNPRLSATTGAPMIGCDRYAVMPDGEVNITVYGEQTVFKKFHPKTKPGTCTITEISPDGKVSEATISVLHPWSWYVKQARKEALAKPQKASSHVESWMGFFSCFLARRHFPDAGLDARADAKFQEIWPLMYDMKKMVPTSWEDRIQNHACAAGLMVARYKATRNIEDLEFAVSLADLMISKQSADGAYRNLDVHYTSVVYIGKSLMEVMAEEKKLTTSDGKWKERYDRHYDSVRRAMDELAGSLDNIQTEGEMTYEDGMISCSCAQLAMFALLQDDPTARQKYLDAAMHFANGHRCLSQLLVPDSRMNGASLRFWESQYDVLTSPNMMTSPHGWSAWRIYGIYYLYLLTGDPDYLRQTMNALGSCVQLIDADSGELRWAFISDPFIEAQVFQKFPEQLGKGRCVGQIVGEQYLPMISGWYQAPPHTFVTGYWGGNPKLAGLNDGESWPVQWHGRTLGDQFPFMPANGWPAGGDGGCCDNDVHEIFKCLEEIALTNGFVIEKPDGSLETWNCSADNQDGTLLVTPSESVISHIHINLQNHGSGKVGAVKFANIVHTVSDHLFWISH